MSMKALISYDDVVRECRSIDDDFVYQIDVSGTINSGNFESLQNSNLADKLIADNGSMVITVSFDRNWDTVNYPEWRSLRNSTVIGIFGHTFSKKNASVLIEWFIDGNSPSEGSPYASHTYNFSDAQDDFIESRISANDYIVINTDVGSGFEQLSNENVTAVKLTFSNTSNQDAGLGRLWIASRFDQDTQLNDSQVFDGGWTTSYPTKGSFDRNIDNSTGFSNAKSVQKQISFSKSNMPYSMAHGLRYSDNSLPIRNVNHKCFAYMYHIASVFNDIVVIPDFTDRISPKQTAVYGTIQGTPQIRKNQESSLYSTTLDVLEIVDEQT